MSAVTSNGETDPHYAYDYPTNYQDALRVGQVFEGVQFFVATVSFLCSVSVLMTAVLFPSMARNKIYMHMILMVSFNDSILAFSGMLGFPAYNTPWCPFQGAIAIFSMRGSWIWAVFILFQLDGIVYTGRLRLNRVCMQLTALALNLLLAFTPSLYGQKYGLAKYYSKLTTCTYVYEYDDNYKQNLASTFLGPMLLSQLLMIILFIKMTLGLGRRFLMVEQNRALVKSVSLYPMVQVLAWFPFVCLTFVLINRDDGPSEALKFNSYIVFEVLETWVFLGGVLTTIIFFRNSAEARERWSKLLRDKRKQCLGGGGDQGRHRSEGMKTRLRDSALHAMSDRYRDSKASCEDDDGDLDYAGEEDFLVDDEMVENIAVTEKEELIRVSRLSRNESFAISITSADTGNTSRRPSGLSEGTYEGRSSEVEMSGMRGSSGSSFSSGVGTGVDGYSSSGEGYGIEEQERRYGGSEGQEDVVAGSGRSPSRSVLGAIRETSRESSRDGGGPPTN